MVNEFADGVNGIKVEHRRLFISHAHADRELGIALVKMVKASFSGVVDVFLSSDPAPSGGISPGDTVYERIRTELRAATTVWVLTTPESVNHP